MYKVMISLGVANAAKLKVRDDPVCSSSGCTQYRLPHFKEDHPRDYRVPDLGVDHEIDRNQDSLDQAEKQTGHTWTFQKAPKENPKDYFVPNFGAVDSDIADTQEHM